MKKRWIIWMIGYTFLICMTVGTALQWYLMKKLLKTQSYFLENTSAGDHLLIKNWCFLSLKFKFLLDVIYYGPNGCQCFEKTMNYLDDNIHVFHLYDCRNSTSVVFNEETAENPKLFSGKHQCRWPSFNEKLMFPFS